MSKQMPHTGARRAAEVVEATVEAEVGTEAPAARRAQRHRFGRRATVGAALVTVVGGATVTKLALSRNPEAPLVSTDLAVPDAAVEAAERGFANRSQTASRNLVRNELSEAVADVTSEDRQQALDTYEKGAYKQMGREAAAERDKKMEADLKKVEKQAAQLKREAEEAARRLEQAKQAAAEKGKTGAVSNPAVSSEDVAAATSKGSSMPLRSGYRIGARFGQRGSWSRYHTGQDFPAPVGTPIYAAASGIVLSPTSGGWAGTNVIIQHGNGGSTLYAHMSRKTVSTGQAVKAGQLIGYVGMSGRTFGPHLHMEYYRPGTTPGRVWDASDPMAFLRSIGAR